MMISLLRPAETVETVVDIDFEKLHALGKEALLFDFDNTLAPKGARAMATRSMRLLDDLAAAGFHIGILSNRRYGKTIADTRFPLIYRARKPRRAGYLTMLKLLSSSPELAVMIGDRYITDILGGNWLGMHTILVRFPPVERD